MPPPNRLARLPPWISHWLGYRSSPPKKQPIYIIYLWSFIGAFCGLSLLQAIFGHAHYFIDRHVPSIIASYGASAVLCYALIDSPVAQPRALIGGHFLSALTGICITKLFVAGISSPARLDSLRWLMGSLSTALAIVVMQVTKTPHPPAGATALLFAVNPDVEVMSWYYLPVVLLSSSLVLVTALIFNNIQRQYPVFWIAPTPPGATATGPALDKASCSISSLEPSPLSTPEYENEGRPAVSGGDVEKGTAHGPAFI